MKNSTIFQNNKGGQILFGLMLFMLLQIINAQAQITIINEETLSQELRTKIAKSIDHPWAKSHSIVEFNAKIEDEISEMTLGFPGIEEEIIVTKKDLLVKIGKKHWKGSIYEGKKKRDGDVIELMDDGEGIYGYANISDNYYSIENLNAEQSLVLLHDPSKYEKSTCLSEGGTKKEENRIRKSDASRTGPNTVNCRVKALVLYTSSASGSVSNITSTINTALSQTNTAFGNSGINGRLINAVPKYLNESLLDIALVEDEDPMLTAEKLANDSYVQNLRSLHKADIIILMHEFDFQIQDNNGTFVVYGGIAADGFADSDLPVAVIKADEASTGRFTFAHEVGHLFDARHEDETGSPPGEGYTFNDGPSTMRSTLLAPTINGNRIQHYSNPDVSFMGQPTGIASQDNSNNINSEFCAISDWVNSYDLILYAPSSGYPGYPTNVGANIDVNRYPCTLRWYADTYPYPQTLKKTQTINPGTSGFYSFTFPSIPNNSFYYIKGDLDPTAGGFSNINKTISIFYSSSYYTVLEETQKKEVEQMILYPNPSLANEDIGFKFGNKKKSGNMIIMDETGNIIDKVPFSNGVGVIDGSRLLRGTYYIVDENTKAIRMLQKF